MLLIHPTRVIKLIAEEMLLDRLPGGVGHGFGIPWDFWRNRVALLFETEQSGNLTISFQSPEEEIDPACLHP